MKASNTIKKKTSRTLIANSFNKTTELNFRGLSGKIEGPKKVVVRRIAGLTAREKSLILINNELEQENKAIVQLIQKLERTNISELNNLKKENVAMKKLLSSSWTSVESLLTEKLKIKLKPLLETLKIRKMRIHNEPLKKELIKKKVEIQELSKELENALNERKAIKSYLNFVQREGVERTGEDLENVGSDADEKEVICCEWESNNVENNTKHLILPNFIKSFTIRSNP